MTEIPTEGRVRAVVSQTGGAFHVHGIDRGDAPEDMALTAASPEGLVCEVWDAIVSGCALFVQPAGEGKAMQWVRFNTAHVSHVRCAEFD